jgi:hypothetical protein
MYVIDCVFVFVVKLAMAIGQYKMFVDGSFLGRDALRVSLTFVFVVHL